MSAGKGTWEVHGGTNFELGRAQIRIGTGPQRIRIDKTPEGNAFETAQVSGITVAKLTSRD
jgi:hypothetical protein